LLPIPVQGVVISVTYTSTGCSDVCYLYQYRV